MKSNKKREKKVSKDYSEKSEKTSEIQFRYIDASRVHDQVKLFNFVEWNALPPQNRSLKTQGDFAHTFGLHIDTLTDWKKIAGFWDEVKSKRDHIFRKYTTKIDYGLAQRAMKGNAREVELWHKLYEGYDEKVSVSNTLPTDAITKEDQDRINFALENIGLASILKSNSKSEGDDF